VLCVGGEQTKILRAVVRRVAVHVVHDLVRIKQSAQHGLHHQSVLTHIPIIVPVRVVRHFLEDVPVFVNVETTVPERVAVGTRLGFQSSDVCTDHRSTYNFVRAPQFIGHVLTTPPLLPPLP
jgi:hypothetical protein